MHAGAAVIKLLQQKLRTLNFSIDEICKTLNRPLIGAIRKTEIDGKEDALFLPTARKEKSEKTP